MATLKDVLTTVTWLKLGKGHHGKNIYYNKFILKKMPTELKTNLCLLTNCPQTYTVPV